MHFEQYMVGLACFYLHMGDVSGCPISKAPKFKMNLLQFNWNVPNVKVNAEWKYSYLVRQNSTDQEIDKQQ